MKQAEKGNIFILTSKGLERSILRGTNDLISEVRTGFRAIGKPIKGYEYSVPESWISEGFVKQYKEDYIEKKNELILTVILRIRSIDLKLRSCFSKRKLLK